MQMDSFLILSLFSGLFALACCFQSGGPVWMLVCCSGSGMTGLPDTAFLRPEVYRPGLIEAICQLQAVKGDQRVALF
jgi:hypothetical protein